MYAKRQSGSVSDFVFEHAWARRDGRDYSVVSRTLDRRSCVALQKSFARHWEEADDYWFHVYRPKAGDTVVDVGAGVGAETTVFSRVVGPSGRVLAIEAHPETFFLLKKQCELNLLANVTMCPLAVIDRVGPVAIEHNPVWESNSVVVLADGDMAGAVVQGNTLDDICRECQIETIDFLKVNIEGAERLAIRGMTKIIKQTSHVCIACHDFLGDMEEFKTREIVIAFLRENGFTITERLGDSRDYVRDHIHATQATSIQ
ncbi:MAG: FkbM family methyltransferase [Vicinamibacterales bacterium]